MEAWDAIPDAEKPFQRRLMEVYAGFAEHVDVQVGRLMDEVEALGYADNTLVFYIWGDNGSSSEGQNGTISELLAQNGIPTTVGQHIAALDALGGLDALGTPLTDNQYHAGWAWAGSTPYKGTKLVASHLGGTRNPMAVRWPAKIKPDATPRPQFHHCNDLTPTIYELVGITPPREVSGVPQDPIDGVSFAYSFDDPQADGRLLTQYFEIMGSRAIYHDGWMASAFGPRVPWVPGLPAGIRDWTPDNDVWELYNLDEDWTQANDLAAQAPEKLAQMKETFLVEATKNKVLPIGGGLWVPILHPEMRLAPPQTEWSFTGDITRMPEVTAPALGNKPNLVTIDAEIPEGANGVLYKLGSNSGGLTLFVEDGVLCYEYNLFIIMRTKIRSAQTLPVGKAKIEVETVYAEPRPAGPLKITLKVNCQTVADGVVPVSAPLLFTANDCLDIGTALGSPVSLDYRDKAPFPFNGVIHSVNVKYIPQPTAWRVSAAGCRGSGRCASVSGPGPVTREAPLTPPLSPQAGGRGLGRAAGCWALSFHSRGRRAGGAGLTWRVGWGQSRIASGRRARRRRLLRATLQNDRCLATVLVHLSGRFRLSRRT